MTTREAAVILRVGESHVSYLARHGHIVGERRGRSWHLDATSVHALAKQRRLSAQGWVSLVAGGEIAECSPSTLALAVRAGQVKHRTGLRRGAPSVELRSVKKWAASRDAARAAAVEQRAEARRQQAALAQPPDDGDVWLSLSTVAIMLRISGNRVQQLIAAERIPATQVGKRWWVRRLHAEQVAAVKMTAAYGIHTSSGGRLQRSGSTRPLHS